MLQALGHPVARYREESFNFDTLAGASADVTDAAPSPDAPATTSFRITLSRLGDSFSCQPGQTLLNAATQAGVRLPASCSTGLCGTCKTRKVSGEVAMSHKGGIRQREIDQGWVLPCCSTPLGDVVLER